MSYLKTIALPQWSRQNIEGSLVRVEEVLQYSKIECRGNGREEDWSIPWKPSVVASGGDQ